MSEVRISVRISLATPEADLAAAVWPGLQTVYHPRTVRLRPLIESAAGVAHAREIAASSARIDALVPNLDLQGDALAYAHGECALIARALGLQPPGPILD